MKHGNFFKGRTWKPKGFIHNFSKNSIPSREIESTLDIIVCSFWDLKSPLAWLPFVWCFCYWKMTKVKNESEQLILSSDSLQIEPIHLF